MKNVITSGAVMLLLLSMFFQCRSTIQTDTVPEAILLLMDTLHQDAQSVKYTIDPKNERVYWLGFTGALHSMRQDGSQRISLNQHNEAWEDVTFIEDFCMNKTWDIIYFTDLMDLQSGQSAIKLTDTAGQRVETVAYLANETPYHISLSSDERTLFFLSKTNVGGKPHFQLRFIDLKEGSRGTLYSSLSKIDSLFYNDEVQVISIRNNRQECFTFSTDLESMKGLAEAFKP